MKALSELAQDLERVLSEKRPVARITGQMTLDSEDSHRTGPQRRSVAEDQSAVTPLQRARMKAAAEAIATGKKAIPLRCAFCHSASLLDEASQIARLDQGRPEDKDLRTPMDVHLNCVSCGRTTRLSTAKAQRRREVRAFIVQGIDVPLTKRQREAAARSNT